MSRGPPRAWLSPMPQDSLSNPWLVLRTYQRCWLLPGRLNSAKQRPTRPGPSSCPLLGYRARNNVLLQCPYRGNFIAQRRALLLGSRTLDWAAHTLFSLPVMGTPLPESASPKDTQVVSRVTTPGLGDKKWEGGTKKITLCRPMPEFCTLGGDRVGVYH